MRTLVIVILILGTLAFATGPKHLYERLGGKAAIEKVVDTFVDSLVKDPQLLENPTIKAAVAHAKPKRLKARISAMVCQATGGPCDYKGKNMRTAHAGMNITEADWNKMVDDFVAALNKYHVPAAEQKDLLNIISTTKGDIVKKG